jgi:uncharacterized protein YjbI with pentapeptide repeats
VQNLFKITGQRLSLGQMANLEHVAQIMKGISVWNAWRRSRPKIAPDLEGVDLSGKDLSGANLADVDLEKAILVGATFTEVDLEDGNLARADLSQSKLVRTILSRANVCGAILNYATIEKSFLNSADFSNASLIKTEISSSWLKGANFVGANLGDAMLADLDLYRTNFSNADLSGADLKDAYLSEANLQNANLRETDLSRASLHGTDFTNATIGRTIFADNDLSTARGLETVVHRAPSEIGVRTAYLSKGNIPEPFLLGCGVPDNFIMYMKSLVKSPTEFYSCFISYSSKDQDFADRLYSDLHSRHISCWFAPHDLQGGKKLHEQIDEAIRLHDKLLLVLSPASMGSEWVKTEIAKARKRELRDHRRVLFPITLVCFDIVRDWECFDADTGKDSAREIREYFIPDFSDWKNFDSYQKALERLISDLKCTNA